MGRARFLGFSPAAWTFVFSSSSVAAPSFFQELSVLPAGFVFPLFREPDIPPSGLALVHAEATTSSVGSSGVLHPDLIPQSTGALLIAPGLSCFHSAEVEFVHISPAVVGKGKDPRREGGGIALNIL